MQTLTEWLPLLLCVAALALWSRFIHVRNRDAGNGWRYIYWQPWRIGAVSIIAGFFVLVLIGATLLHHCS